MRMMEKSIKSGMNRPVIDPQPPRFHPVHKGAFIVISWQPTELSSCSFYSSQNHEIVTDKLKPTMEVLKFGYEI